VLRKNREDWKGRGELLETSRERARSAIAGFCVRSGTPGDAVIGTISPGTL